MAESLTPEAVRSLIANKAPESQKLEYKLELPKGSSGEKKEFLADVAAIANTAGGVILYGIDEERDANGQPTGLPTSIPGVPVANEDMLRRSWEQMFGTGLNPPLRGTTVQLLDVDGKQVVALTIPRSPRAPHAVWFEGSGRYWRRSSSGKYHVEPEELKAMFLEHGAWETEALQYHAARVAQIRSGMVLPSAAISPGTIILHLLPLGRLRGSVVQIDDGLSTGVISLWSHNRTGGFDYNPTIDGFILHCGRERWDLGFIQVLRFGGLEVCVGSGNSHRGPKGESIFDVGRAADMVKSYGEKGFSYLLKSLSVEPPFALAVTAVNVEKALGCYYNSHGVRNAASLPYLQSQIQLPLVAINEEAELPKAVKHLSDLFWHSAGFAAPSV